MRGRVARDSLAYGKNHNKKTTVFAKTTVFEKVMAANAMF